MNYLFANSKIKISFEVSCWSFSLIFQAFLKIHEDATPRKYHFEFHWSSRWNFLCREALSRLNRVSWYLSFMESCLLNELTQQKIFINSGFCFLLYDIQEQKLSRSSFALHHQPTDLVSEVKSQNFTWGKMRKVYFLSQKIYKY